MASLHRGGSMLAVIGAVALGGGALASCGSSSHHGSVSKLPTVAGLRSVWGQPAGGGHPRALLLMIHGGGWKGLDSTSYKSQVEIAAAYQKLGYETLTFNYRGGAQSVQDAESFYRLARRTVGPRLPICALGPSAGGHIALMLAVQNPGLACVIDFAGPTDLGALASQPGGKVAYQLAVNAFGTNHLAAYSPALHADSIKAKVMLVFAQNDPIVPLAQGTEMAHALPTGQLIVLPPGPVGFVHSAVAAAPYEKSLASEESFLLRATRSS